MRDWPNTPAISFADVVSVYALVPLPLVRVDPGPDAVRVQVPPPVVVPASVWAAAFPACDSA
ncbi:MAG: hypothetical protein ABGY75_03555 [Gemmataceae bacterium]